MRPARGFCRDCAFWAKLRADKGHCRHDAPKLGPQRWPEAEAEEWCGKFEIDPYRKMDALLEAPE